VKAALKIVSALLAVCLSAAGGALFWIAHKAQGNVRQGQELLLSQWRHAEPQLKRDSERFKDDPLFAPHEGGDAAPLLMAHIRWESDVDKPSPVPGALWKQMNSSDGGWAQHADELDVKGVDTAWMSGLAAAGYLDLEGPGTKLENAPYVPLSSDLPSFVDLMMLSRVRLVQGLQSGDARAAGREVHEAARLCLSSESLIGGLFAVPLLTMERRAHEEAVRRGQDVTGWTTVSEDDLAALKRIVYVSPAPYSLLATGPLAASTPQVARCIALQESVAMAHFLRRFAESEVPEQYAALTKALDESPCRLRRARAAWKANDPAGQLPDSGKALCRKDLEKSEDCATPDAVVLLPFMHAFIGRTLMVTAQSGANWFKLYDER
jgi:hypothetical protein